MAIDRLCKHWHPWIKNMHRYGLVSRMLISHHGLVCDGPCDWAQLPTVWTWHFQSNVVAPCGVDSAEMWPYAPALLVGICKVASSRELSLYQALGTWHSCGVWICYGGYAVFNRVHTGCTLVDSSCHRLSFVRSFDRHSFLVLEAP